MKAWYSAMCFCKIIQGKELFVNIWYASLFTCSVYLFQGFEGQWYVYFTRFMILLSSIIPIRWERDKQHLSSLNYHYILLNLTSAAPVSLQSLMRRCFLFEFWTPCCDFDILQGWYLRFINGSSMISSTACWSYIKTCGFLKWIMYDFFGSLAVSYWERA